MSQPGAQSVGLNLSADDVRMLEQLRGRLMRLNKVIEEFQSQMAKNGEIPPPWPVVHRLISHINNQVRSFHEYFNEERTQYTETRGQALSALRVYPIAPFPAEEMRLVLETILRKKPTPEDEKWVEERLRAASEFCRVPEEWISMTGKSEESGQGKARNDDEFGGIKRVKVPMDEDDIAALWDLAPGTTFTVAETFNQILTGQGDEDNPVHEQISRDIGLDETPDATPESSAEGDEAPKPPAPLPLGAVLKFMSTGQSIIPPGVNA